MILSDKIIPVLSSTPAQKDLPTIKFWLNNQSSKLKHNCFCNHYQYQTPINACDLKNKLHSKCAAIFEHTKNSYLFGRRQQTQALLLSLQSVAKRQFKKPSLSDQCKYSELQSQFTHWPQQLQQAAEPVSHCEI